MRKKWIQGWDNKDYEEEQVVETNLLGKKCLYHLIGYLQQGDKGTCIGVKTNHQLRPRSDKDWRASRLR